MPTQFNCYRDQTGAPAYTPQFTDDNYNVQLAANTAQTVTVPSTASNWVAIFSYDPGLRVFVANNATAVVPGGAFAKSSSQLLPNSRVVKAADILSFITPDTSAFVGVSFYAL